MVYAGQESSTLESVDLAAVVREMFPLMTVSAAKNAVFEFHLEDGLTLIRVNVAQIPQVFLNLITNASEALGGKEGSIRVSLKEIYRQTSLGDESPESPGIHCLRLEVSDTGCGMTDRISAGIFDPFFSTKGAGRGQDSRQDGESSAATVVTSRLQAVPGAAPGLRFFCAARLTQNKSRVTERS
jgi:two-component system cell cycle sensor histidine kinase/response regulator CckA